MQQQTLKAKRERIERLERRLHDLKSGMYMGQHEPTLAKMLYWFTQTYWKMPREERQEIMRAWDAYYDKCYQSPLRAGFEIIPSPQGYDPMIWDKSDFCQQFRAVESELKRLGSENDDEFETRTGSTW